MVKLMNRNFIINAVFLLSAAVVFAGQNQNNVYFISGDEKSGISKNEYTITGEEGPESDASVPKDGKRLNNGLSVYEVTGEENKFNLTYLDLRKVYNIDGSEDVQNAEKKLKLNDIQKSKLEYLEMEEKYKVGAIEKDLQIKKKMLEDELSKDNFDAYVIDNLSNDIKQLASDIEKIRIDAKKKTRRILLPEQYSQYELQKNKTGKKNKK